MTNPLNVFAATCFAAAATIALGLATAPKADAANISCYGSDTYQSCTYSDWVNGEYVTCYGTITSYSESWNCY